MTEYLCESGLPCPSKIEQMKDYFKAKNVFITGGSGFMGKVLIEKLLWSCEEIGHIYILCRSKRGLSAKQRLDDMLRLEMFDRIRNRDERILNKVIPITGNMLDINLGLNEEDEQILRRNVSVVFHMAANVRFQESLSRAILVNVRGTRDVLNLARNMGNLIAFVHVSTTYANTHQQNIDEEVHSYGGDWRTFIKIAETLNPTELALLEEKILGYQPNTYTFTKHLAENVVNEYRHEIPVLIFRPSVVIFCAKEPIEGWIDNFTGEIALWLAYLTGVMHILLTTSTTRLDHIPCDMAINALMVSACYRGNSDSKQCITINAASGERNRYSYRYLFDIGISALNVYPPLRLLWYPSFYIVENYYLYIVLSYILHVIPGFFFEIMLKVKGINFSILKIYRKIYAMHKHIIFFTNNDFNIISKNYFSLDCCTHPYDKEDFPIDMHTLDDTELTYIALKGFKKYLLKEKNVEANLQKAKKNHTRLYYMDRMVRAIVILLLSYIAYQVIWKFIEISTGYKTNHSLLNLNTLL